MIRLEVVEPVRFLPVRTIGQRRRGGVRRERDPETVLNRFQPTVGTYYR